MLPPPPPPPAEVKRLRGSVPGRQDSVREMARSHQYTLQLERQLRHFLGSGEQQQQQHCQLPSHCIQLYMYMYKSIIPKLSSVSIMLESFGVWYDTFLNVRNFRNFIKYIMFLT